MNKIPEEWKLVPVEPTEEMLKAALIYSSYPQEKEEQLMEDRLTDYRLMLAAAPTPPAQEVCRHPIDQVEAWAGDYEKDGHALIAQMLRSYARLLAAPTPPAQEVEPVGLIEFKEKINQWAQAYPRDIFPEPDFERANKVLKAEGMNVDLITASAMRHVIARVNKMLDTATPLAIEDDATPTR